jgi:AcrR family transcriptional regulator
MREIAEEADLSAANLYYYFRNRDELLFFCQDDSLDRLLARVAEARARARSPADQLRRVLEAHVICVLDELAGAMAHLEVDLLPPGQRARIVAKRDRYERALRRIVSAGVRSGAFVRCDAALVTRAILGALNWTARWYRPGGAKTPGEIARTFSGYLVRGLVK